MSFTFQNSQLLLDVLFAKNLKPKRVVTIYDPDDSVTVDVICKEKTVTLHHLQNQNVYRTSVLINGKEERFFFSKPENLKSDFEKNLN